VEPEDLDLTISGEIWYWRGPSPFHFVTVPPDAAAALRAVSTAVTYGWGMIPVHARIGDTAWTTSLFPRDGGYVVPVKDAVRSAEGLGAGDTVTVRLAIRR
jgi:hypothetical protein